MALTKSTIEYNDKQGVSQLMEVLINGSNKISLGALTDSDGNLISKNNGLHVEQVDGSSANYYSASFNIAPTTLTTGLNYFIIRNPHASKKLKIKKIGINTFFAGIAAASKSIFVCKKYTGVTATTGTVIQPSLRDSIGTPSIAEIKQLSTGLAVTGGTDANNLFHIGIPNQLTVCLNKDIEYTLPLILNQNEAIVIQSEGAIVLGANISLSIQYYEV